MSPGAVLALCSRLYGKTLAAYLLEIAGASFELREGMSAEGKKNVEKATHFLAGLLPAVSIERFEGVVSYS